MDLQVPTAPLVALALGTARGTGFVLMAPPFNSSAVPGPVKAAMALALAVTVYGRLSPGLGDPTAGFLIVTGVTEVAIGAALGFLVQMLFSAVQTAGGILDVSGGFTLQPAYDPLALTTNGPVGKLHFQLATTLLFTSGGHLLMVRGFVESYKGLPLGASLPTGHLAQDLIKAFSMMFLAALQIAGPMVAVLLLADIALGLLSRAAPALNVFQTSFPVKIMLTLALLGLTFPLLPPALNSLIEQATRAIVSLKGG
ncbi:MAG: flagellar biosynthetic protein FliR [Catenulispora sp.]